MMSLKRLYTQLILILSTIGLTGCITAFTVKNTEGLHLAYRDIDRASSYASKLISMRGIPPKSLEEAADLYRQAKSELNSYLQNAITAASDYDVNNPKEEYLATQCTPSVDAFEKKVKELRGFRPMSASAWIPIAEAVINKIWELNQKAREGGRKSFEETVTKYMMKNFEEIPSASGAD